MEIGVILEVISTVGFPIALVIALGWFIFKIYNQSVEREAKLMAEIAANREEIAENRKVNEKAIETIALYAERLGHIESSITEIKEDVVLIKEKIN